MSGKFGNCYCSVKVISFSLSQSDHIKIVPVYLSSEHFCLLNLFEGVLGIVGAGSAVQGSTADGDGDDLLPVCRILPEVRHLQSPQRRKGQTHQHPHLGRSGKTLY